MHAFRVVCSNDLQILLHKGNTQSREPGDCLLILRSHYPHPFHILYRRDAAIAEEKVRNLRAYGIEIVPLMDNAIWREAGRIKGEHAISLADAFAVATAIAKKDKLVVGRDDDFKKVNVPQIKVR